MTAPRNHRLAPAGGASRGQRTDLGVGAVELVITMPGLLLAVMLIVQVGLWQHAQHVALAAAQEGARAARQHDAAAGRGQQRAEAYLEQLAPTILKPRAVTTERTSTTATVRVRGEAVSVFPWLAFRVDQASTGPVERFVPQIPVTARP
jgi:Flp pilus assembly protein TadG